jgi:hypothetical protein
MSSSQSQCRAEGEVVAPFLRPSYGAYSVARRKWRKPVAAVIADALANTRELSARLKGGVYGPPDTPQEVFEQMCQCTDAQLAALEVFSQFRWRDR